ncbi:AAA family ATPase [Paenibacillus yanchengensis]|uniref:AAA family ATPase n=1 Tax=Paenibacillus yanchengensis TaxID=2035833 RepID=A0ABW4YK56_9BACL
MSKYWKEIVIGIVPIGLFFLVFLNNAFLPIAIVALLAVVLLFIASRGKSGLMAMPVARSERQTLETSFSFAEIGGQERAKQELVEALDFLVKPEQIEKLGIRPLKGILLTGPPGTGKTLLAKAAAHYTDSIYLATSGSEFVEMYVGVGAGRIRDLFQEARKKAKKLGKSNAIIFIDEIDVIGGRRDGGQQREYDQTLNQLLTEMDGIHSEVAPRIFIIAATNRKELLDSALIRPGRFDRHIEVGLPDKKGRLHILNIHAKNKPLATSVDLERIATQSYSFSGAQLESVMNEAAIYALRHNLTEITETELTMAIDKVLMGEKTDREAAEEERNRVARHELGHAIMAEIVSPGSVAQITVAPRGEALGFVRHHPEQDKALYTKQFIYGQIKIALAGAAAEEIYYGERSTGSRGDFDQAVKLVRTLVESGMTELGIVNQSMMTPDGWATITRTILDQLMSETKDSLLQHKQVLDRALDVLICEETMNGNEFRQLLVS